MTRRHIGLHRPTPSQAAACTSDRLIGWIVLCLLCGLALGQAVVRGNFDFKGQVNNGTKD